MMSHDVTEHMMSCDITCHFSCTFGPHDNGTSFISDFHASCLCAVHTDPATCVLPNYTSVACELGFIATENALKNGHIVCFSIVS